MIKLGDYNTLTLTRFTDHGAYMDGGEVGEILLPKAYVTRDMRPGTQVDVFVYLDQGERLVGTFETPLCRVGDFAMLRVAWVNEYGAFLHAASWPRPKWSATSSPPPPPATTEGSSWSASFSRAPPSASR